MALVKIFVRDSELFRRFFKNIIEKKPAEIWGDGEAVRDYLYIEDFIHLCRIIIEKRVIPTYRRRIYNVGSGQGVSLNNLLTMIEQVTGKHIVRQYHPTRGVDVETNILNCTRMNEDYGWQVQKILQEGLKETWEWFQKVYR